jgi:ubiquitin-protein ligase
MTQLELLDSIQPISLRKRIKGEFYRMLPIYNNVTINKEKDKLNFVIEKTDKNQKKIIYKFVISNHYPYHPPVVFINNIHYGQYLQCPNKFLNILKYIRGIDCLCCVSCTCKSNWFPAMTLKYILEEIENNNNTKHNIMMKILLDKIKEKFLNRDIDLDSWLFRIACPGIIIPGSIY